MIKALFFDYFNLCCSPVRSSWRFSVNSGSIALRTRAERRMGEVDLSRSRHFHWREWRWEETGGQQLRWPVMRQSRYVQKAILCFKWDNSKTAEREEVSCGLRECCSKDYELAVVDMLGQSNPALG